MKLTNKQLAIASLITMILLAGCMSYMPIGDDEEIDSAYEAIPDNSNIVLNADIVGLAEDDVTENLFDGMINELEQEQGVDPSEQEDISYSELYNEYVNIIETEMNEEIDSVDLSVNNLENMYMFSNINFEDYTDFDDPTHQPEMDEDFGLIIQTDLTDDDLTNIFNELEEDSDETVTVEEYNGYDMYIGDNDEVILAVLDDMIIVSLTEDYTETIIDTYVGDNDHISEDMVVSDDSYLGMSITGMDSIWSDIQEDLDDFEDDPMWDEIPEEDREEFEEIQDAPAPQSITFSYETEGDDMIIDYSMTFANEDAVSEWERLFDDDDDMDGVDIDISIDSTTISTETRVDSNYLVEQFGVFIDGFMTGFESGQQDFDDDFDDDFDNSDPQDVADATIDISENESKGEISVQIVRNENVEHFELLTIAEDGSLAIDESSDANLGDEMSLSMDGDNIPARGVVEVVAYVDGDRQTFETDNYDLFEYDS